MFINANAVHKKYGHGIITDIEMDPSDQLKSKISVRFDDGEIKKFSIVSFNENSFFTTDDDEIIPFVKSLIEEDNKKKEATKKAEEERKEYSPVVEYTKEEWEKAYKVAEEHRFKYESRAVIMDDDIIFISASDALKHLDLDAKSGDRIYAVCDIPKKKHKILYGHEWEYATKADIKKILDKYEVVNDTK